MAEDRSERKLATVLFADLAGSTALAGEQDPERTRPRLERFYDAMAAQIEAAGGTIEKFAGDAVMAAFGAPDAFEDHAERALHAALSMQRRLEHEFAGALALRIDSSRPPNRARRSPESGRLGPHAGRSSSTSCVPWRRRGSRTAFRADASSARSR